MQTPKKPITGTNARHDVKLHLLEFPVLRNFISFAFFCIVCESFYNIVCREQYYGPNGHRQNIIESQKGIIDALRCSLKNQNGATTIDFVRG